MTARAPLAPGEPGAEPSGAAKRVLPEAAKRALAEAAARLAQGNAHRPREHGGRGAPDPVRYGDWESRGLAIDF